MEVLLCSLKPAVPVHVTNDKPSTNDAETDLPEQTSLNVNCRVNITRVFKDTILKLARSTVSSRPASRGPGRPANWMEPLFPSWQNWGQCDRGGCEDHIFTKINWKTFWQSNSPCRQKLGFITKFELFLVRLTLLMMFLYFLLTNWWFWM